MICHSSTGAGGVGGRGTGSSPHTQMVLNCSKCPLKDRPFVPGIGPGGITDIMIVGEAPGRTEGWLLRHERRPNQVSQHLDRERPACFGQFGPSVIARELGAVDSAYCVWQPLV